MLVGLQLKKKKAIDSIIGRPRQVVNYSVKKGTWQHVESSEKFEMLVLVSSVRVETNGRDTEREVATVMSFVHIKGKLLTLKIVNSKDQSDPAQSAVSAMRTWLDSIMLANAR